MSTREKDIAAANAAKPDAFLNNGYYGGFADGSDHARRQAAEDLREEAKAARRLGRNDEADNLDRLAGRIERGEHVK